MASKLLFIESLTTNTLNFINDKVPRNYYKKLLIITANYYDNIGPPMIEDSWGPLKLFLKNTHLGNVNSVIKYVTKGNIEKDSTEIIEDILTNQHMLVIVYVKNIPTPTTSIFHFIEVELINALSTLNENSLVVCYNEIIKLIMRENPKKEELEIITKKINKSFYVMLVMISVCDYLGLRHNNNVIIDTRNYLMKSLTNVLDFQSPKIGNVENIGSQISGLFVVLFKRMENGIPVIYHYELSKSSNDSLIAIGKNSLAEQGKYYSDIFVEILLIKQLHQIDSLDLATNDDVIYAKFKNSHAIYFPNNSFNTINAINTRLYKMAGESMDFLKEIPSYYIL